MVLSLRDRLTKVKKFQNLGNSLALLIPNKMLQVLDWDQDTKVVLEVRPIRDELLIIQTTSEMEVPSEEAGDSKSV